MTDKYSGMSRNEILESILATLEIRHEMYRKKGMDELAKLIEGTMNDIREILDR